MQGCSNTHAQIHHSSLPHLRVSSISITRKRLWKAGSVRAPATIIGIVDSQRRVQRAQWMCFIFTKPILGCPKAGIVTLTVTNYPSSDVTMRSLWFTLKSVGSLQLPKSPNHTNRPSTVGYQNPRSDYSLAHQKAIKPKPAVWTPQEQQRLQSNLLRWAVRCRLCRCAQKPGIVSKGFRINFCINICRRY